jgi:hypothetical protein
MSTATIDPNTISKTPQEHLNICQRLLNDLHHLKEKYQQSDNQTMSSGFNAPIESITEYLTWARDEQSQTAMNTMFTSTTTSKSGGSGT